MSWEAILVLVAGSYGAKLFGTVVLARVGGTDGAVDGRLAWFPAMVALIPPALFAALIAVQTLDHGGTLRLDARVVGVAAGAVAVWRKLPFVVVVLLAMAVTAAIRWQT
ncbi:MAG: AzlD domain-containing protein [Acidimicrobiales bacterium]